MELRADNEIEAVLRVSCFKFGPRGLTMTEAEPLPPVDDIDIGDEDDDDDDDEDEADELIGSFDLEGLKWSLIFSKHHFQHIFLLFRRR